MANKEVKGAAFYQHLQRYVLNEAQLRQNGFPEFVPGHTDTVTMEKSERTIANHCSNPDERICKLCQDRFLLADNGKAVCRHHWGKSFRQKPWTCCSGSYGSLGCVTSEYHVYADNEYYDLHGYVSTLPSEEMDDEKDRQIYSLDCEMVYTIDGSELAKITVIDQYLDVVYEEAVKPGSKVIDYNTRFSGLTKDDLRGVTTSLKDVQAALLRLCTDKTILVGHSLDHDLVVLKLVHRTVVDTSVVFPHRQGPPYKKGLKKLCEDHLGKRIQVNCVGGHDSREDASACMELMLQRVKRDRR